MSKPKSSNLFDSDFLNKFNRTFGVSENKVKKEETTRVESAEESEEESEEELEGGEGFDYYNFYYCDQGNVIHLYDQVFEEIRAECFRRKKLFRDPKFPTSKASFYKNYNEMKPRVVYTWLRPGEISDSPSLVSGGVSRFDTRQGAIGDCWFVSAVSNFAHLQEKDKNMFTQVVPQDQGFDENYAGVFRFRFWQYGDWVEVVVDDRLPTRYGKLACLSSMDADEYWAALLEKAYAKLQGSYESLSLGDGSEAFVDLTGAISDLHQAPYPDNLYDLMRDAYENDHFIGCIHPQLDSESVTEEVTEDGLVTNHYYGVTAVRTISYEFLGEAGRARMVRVRNPWANSTEWTGAGSDESAEWKFIPQEMKDSLDLKVDDDGEFWMPFKVFCEKFDKVEICHKSPHEDDSSYSVQAVHRKWSQSPEDVDENEDHDTLIARILPSMPQHFITVESDDTTVIVQLIDKNRRRNYWDYQTIQLLVYSSPEHSSQLDEDHLKNDENLIDKKTNFGRDLTWEAVLNAGRYAIIPANSDKANAREYYLRVIHNNNVTVTFAASADE